MSSLILCKCISIISQFILEHDGPHIFLNVQIKKEASRKRVNWGGSETIIKKWSTQRKVKVAEEEGIKNKSLETDSTIRKNRHHHHVKRESKRPSRPSLFTLFP